MEEPPRRIVRTADGRIAVRLAARERAILAALAAELAHETSGAAGGDAELDARPAADDPGLARLRPDAVRGDPAASADFRDLTARDLEDARQARLAILAEMSEATSLDDAQASAWLGAVNDVRLVRGTRLGVTEETGRDPIDETGPQAGDTILYLWLGWVEEQLVEALAAGLPGLAEDPGADEAPG